MVEIKKLDKRAIIPEYSTTDSAGLDLIACMDNKIEIPPFKTAMIHTGLAINMDLVDAHIMAMLLPRSGKGAKEGKILGNLVGIIDQDYHGELMVCLWNRNSDQYVTIEPGERFAQMVFVPIYKVTFNEVVEFSSKTERGTGGFGSTG
jgi:dUTP pyrophosphatase